MKDPDFTRLLTKCAKAAQKHHELMQSVAEECEARYGCHYSDLDADSLIDVLDLHGGEKFTAAEFGDIMKSYGAQRIDNQKEISK